MDPKHLVYLAEIINLGSLSRAARRLNVGQPTLSRIVKVIEDKVGSPVLRRGRYGVTPTVIGERLASQGREIAESAERAASSIDHWKKGLTGEVRLSVGPMLAATIMRGFFENALKQKWPYSIEVVAEFAARAIEALNSAKLDAAILPSRLNLHQENLSQDLLFSDRLAIFAGADSALARADKRYSISDVAELPWIETAAISGIHGSMREIMMQNGVDVQLHRLRFSGDVMMALQLIANSDALCILPERQLEKYALAHTIKKLDVDIALPKRDISFWTTKASRDTPEIRHLHAQLISHLQRIDLTPD